MRSEGGVSFAIKGCFKKPFGVVVRLMIVAKYLHVLPADVGISAASEATAPHSARSDKTHFNGVGRAPNLHKLQGLPDESFTMDCHRSKPNGTVFGIQDWLNDLWHQAATCRKLVERADDPLVKSELLCVGIGLRGDRCQH
jgi:hypothetical protein